MPAPALAVVGPEGLLAAYGDLGRVDRWASVSKLVTAYAVLMAVQDEELNLDLAAGPPGSSIRHLLAHASGLPFEGAVPIAKPGASRIYSNAGFDLLGTVVEEATGIRFDDYISWQVSDPLGLAVSVVGPPSAGLAGSVEALALLAQELLVPTLLDSRALAGAVEVAFPGLSGVIPGIGRFDPCDWGLGFELRDAKSPHWTGSLNSPATFGHFGGSGSFLWVDPSPRLAMCGLTGREFDRWALEAWPPLFDAVLSATADP